MKRIKKVLAALATVAALSTAVVVAPAGAGVIQSPEDSYLVCTDLIRAAALYFPIDSAPRYNIYAIRIDGGQWSYAHMYFSHGQEWQLLNGAWVPTSTNWAGIWAPDDGRRHFVEVYEARSRDNRNWSSWIKVASPCHTSTLWAPWGH